MSGFQHTDLHKAFEEFTPEFSYYPLLARFFFQSHKDDSILGHVTKHPPRSRDSCLSEDHYISLKADVKGMFYQSP